MIQNNLNVRFTVRKKKYVNKIDNFKRKYKSTGIIFTFLFLSLPHPQILSYLTKIKSLKYKNTF